MWQKRDSEIEQWLLRELRLEHAVSSKELCIFCSDGIATLNGTVKNDREERAALRAAERVAGVLRVINNIGVREAARWAVISPSAPAIAPILHMSAVSVLSMDKGKEWRHD